MKEQMFLYFFQSVDGQLTNLITAVETQLGVAKIVKRYDWSITKELLEKIEECSPNSYCL